MLSTFAVHLNTRMRYYRQMPWGRTPHSSCTGMLPKAHTVPDRARAALKAYFSGIYLTRAPEHTRAGIHCTRASESHQSKLQQISARALSITSFRHALHYSKIRKNTKLTTYGSRNCHSIIQELHKCVYCGYRLAR